MPHARLHECRIISVLEMENDQLKGQQGRTGTVIPMVGAR